MVISVNYCSTGVCVIVCSGGYNFICSFFGSSHLPILEGTPSYLASSAFQKLLGFLDICRNIFLILALDGNAPLLYKKVLIIVIQLLSNKLIIFHYIYEILYMLNQYQICWFMWTTKYFIMEYLIVNSFYLLVSIHENINCVRIRINMIYYIDFLDSFFVGIFDFSYFWILEELEKIEKSVP